MPQNELPQIDPEEFGTISTSGYEVLDRKLDLSQPAPENPIEIHEITSTVTYSGINYTRQRLAGYPDFEAGIRENENDEKRIKQIRNTLVIAAAAGIAVTAKDYVDILAHKSLTQEDAVKIGFEPILTLIAGMSSVVANRAVNGARERRDVLFKALKAKKLRYFHSD